MIQKWSEYILTETLKTFDIDLTIKNIDKELDLLNIEFKINKEENKIELTLPNFKYTQPIHKIIKTIESLFIDRFGWFPSSIKATNIYGRSNTASYNPTILINNQENIQSITIIFEAKYDELREVPSKLYHVSIQEYKNNILKRGLIPKSNSKRTVHLDRIYVCKTVEAVKTIINQLFIPFEFELMRNDKNNKNIKYMILEIDTTGLDLKLYSDPNYKLGYYLISNIPPTHIKIIEEE